MVQSESDVKARILKRFNEEIAALERELKVDLPKEIQRAREYGDLRENAEYKAAKERQEIVNARIAMLKKRVGEAMSWARAADAAALSFAFAGVSRARSLRSAMPA
mgnify:CR=1 FL=1